MTRVFFIENVPSEQLSAIRDLYEDKDGIWVHIRDSHALKDYKSSHIINEKTLAEVINVLKNNLVAI